MATRKKAPKQDNGSGSKKKGASKKGNGGPGLLEQDPPIVVGGGNSTLVWIPKGYTQVQNPQPTVYLPDPDYYDCFRVDYDTVTIQVGDGANPYKPHPVKHHMNHNTRFSKT